jgi:hypothetical protein
MKQKTIFLAAVLAAGLGSATSTFGYGRWYAGRGVGLGYGLGYGMGAYAYGGGAGTAFSAQQQAVAETIRAQGEYGQMASEALMNYEQARSTYIDNQEKWTQVYLERRRAVQAIKAEQQEARVASRERYQEHLASHPPAGPPRPTSSQLDSSTGTIHWPEALSSSAFESQRKTLDELFALRAHTSTVPDLSVRIDKAVREMKDALRGKIRDMPSQEYIAARRFLDSLSVEGRSPVN